MDHNHSMPGMGGGSGGAMTNDTAPGPATMMNPHKMMMHMTFFWGTEAEILFSGWPGTRTGMYVLALVVVFVLAFLVEWLSHCKLIKSTGWAAGLLQTIMYMIRVGLGYLVMLAVMSFNVGVFVVALAGHTLGFLVFGSRLLQKKNASYEKTLDLPTMSC